MLDSRTVHFLFGLSTLDLTRSRFHQGLVSVRIRPTSALGSLQTVQGFKVALWLRLETPSRPLVNPS